jgi:hypothetical protein
MSEFRAFAQFQESADSVKSAETIKRLGLKIFILTSSYTPQAFRIVAKDRWQAWRKFFTQYFPALKPDRSDWTIQEVKER